MRPVGFFWGHPGTPQDRNGQKCGESPASRTDWLLRHLDWGHGEGRLLRGPTWAAQGGAPHITPLRRPAVAQHLPLSVAKAQPFVVRTLGNSRKFLIDEGGCGVCCLKAPNSVLGRLTVRLTQNKNPARTCAGTDCRPCDSAARIFFSLLVVLAQYRSSALGTFFYL